MAKDIEANATAELAMAIGVVEEILGRFAGSGRESIRQARRNQDGRRQSLQGSGSEQKATRSDLREEEQSCKEKCGEGTLVLKGPKQRRSGLQLPVALPPADWVQPRCRHPTADRQGLPKKQL